MSWNNIFIYLCVIGFAVIIMLGMSQLTKLNNSHEIAKSVCSGLEYDDFKLYSNHTFYCYEYEEHNGSIYKVKTKEYNINSIGEDV